MYSDGNDCSYQTAKKLQDFFTTTELVNLEIRDDSAVQQQKEILVGNTNRYVSGLQANQFAVILQKDKLIIEGGHFTMVEKAADFFMTSECRQGYVTTLSGIAKDFKATLNDGYTYVWGDEFDGTTLDAVKWKTDKSMMVGTESLAVLTGDEAEKAGVITVNGGLLRLSAREYSDPQNPLVKYATGEVCTWDKMNFKYGYAEIRARLPMSKGVWPSWWLTTGYASSLFENGYNYMSVPYKIEVDIFESFGSETTIVPNFHKWWDETAVGTPYDSHSVYPEQNTYKFAGDNAIKYKYHIFGFEWTPDKMTLSVDGVPYMFYDLKDGFPDEDNSLVNQPLQMILTNYLFADDYTGMNISDDNRIIAQSLPAELFIDYVRLYQKPGVGGVATGDLTRQEKYKYFTLIQFVKCTVANFTESQGISCGSCNSRKNFI